MIKEHTHDRASTIAACLFSITIIGGGVDEVGNTAVNGEPGSERSLRAVTVQIEREEQAAQVPAEAKDGDGVWSECRWQF